jgi:serine/threonine-protein kinase PpkA
VAALFAKNAALIRSNEKMKTKFRAVLPLLLVLTMTAAWADDFTDLKEAIQLREPAVKELKAHGMLREGPNGFLESASGAIDPAQRNILDRENSERLRMFQLVAQRNHLRPEEVAQAFQHLAARAPQFQAATPAAPVAAAQPVTSEPPANSQPSRPVSNDRSPAQPVTSEPPANSEPSHPVSNDRSPALPLKVLTRPFANVYAAREENSQKARENVPAFTAFYVYQKGNGWYQVGTDNHGKTIGWMREVDVIEWKQNLVVEFTHPEGRKPVLLFGDKEELVKIVSAPKSSRVERVDALYKKIDRGNLPSTFPVLTMEPQRAVQSRNQFYLLPIINSEDTEIDGREGRLLQLAATTRERGAVLLSNERNRSDLTRGADQKYSSGVKVDLVFVMDLTLSMGPFADRTMEMINNCLRGIGADDQVVEAMRFGFWGYRDFPENCPGIEFNTRNYTPTLQRLSEFATTLRSVKETKVDSVDYPEDVFAGVTDAIQQTQWRKDALRLMVLVGDAPGRRPGEFDPACSAPNRPVGTRSGMNEVSIRHLADESNVYVTALYLFVPKWKQYAAAGERQFRTFSRNPNDQPGGENFRMVNARDTTVFAATAQSLADGILQHVKSAQGRGNGSPDQNANPSTDINVETVESARTAGRDLASNMFRGAMVEWLGKEDAATIPQDVTAWATDKDLIDPTIQSLEVKVFLTKDELNSLKLVVDRVLDAGTRGKITGENFFQALQAVVAAAASNPEQIRTAETLAKTGLVPEFLKGLPYRSTLMDMNNESWRNMSPDAQDQFLRGVESKLRFYQAIHDNSENWQALNEGDDRDNWVASVPLDELP